MPELSDEAYLSRLLFSLLSNCPSVTVHFWHPPSSKVYFGQLLPIPKRRSVRKTKERYHLDGVAQIGTTLLLIELKGAASGLHSDWQKLQELSADYSVDELVALMQPRVHEPAPLARATGIHACLGYRVTDCALTLPATVFHATDHGKLAVKLAPDAPNELLKAIDDCEGSSITLL